MQMCSGINITVLLMAVGFAILASAEENAGHVSNLQSVHSIDIRGKISGEILSVIDCSFGLLDQGYELTIMPFRRAQHNVWQGSADGYFATVKNKEDEQHAKLSAPIALERWYWYSLTNTSIPIENRNKQQKIAHTASLNGTNTEIWLKSQKNYSYISARSIEQLFKLLELKRIDAFLLDQAMLNDRYALKRINNLKITFSRYMPLSIYFSHVFLEQHPGFLSRFNNTQPWCVNNNLELSREEQSALYNTAINNIQSLTKENTIIDAIVQQNSINSHLTEVDIKRLDTQWRLERMDSSKPLINSILNKEVSIYLKKIKQQSQGLFGEIIVMDKRGLNVGQSDETTDYWQGDEDKFLRTFNNEYEDKIYIDDIHYDESSLSFLSQVSLTITDTKSENVIGVITVGVNVEKALSKND